MTLNTTTCEMILDKADAALAEVADAGLELSDYDISANWECVQIRVSIDDTDDDAELPGSDWEWTGDSNTDAYGETTSDARIMIRCESPEDAEAMAARIIAKL